MLVIIFCFFVNFCSSQVVKLDFSHACSGDGKPCDMFTPSVAKEKWQKKRTQVKIRVSCIEKNWPVA